MSATTTEGKTIMIDGRIVWVSGDLFAGRQKTDPQTRAPLFNADGKPKMEFGFGLAVPKSVLANTAPGQPGEIFTVMQQEAMKIFPSGQFPPDFAWKYKDGDGIDHNGVSFAQREGHAQHIIFACTTAIQIKFFRHENGQNFNIADGIKCGDYVRVQLTIKAHPAINRGKAGLYLNPNAVLFIGHGKEIINTPSGDQIFGTVAPVLPPGASATPVAPMTGMLTPQAQPTFAQPQYGGQPMQQQAPVPQAAPHYAVLPPVHQPQAQQGMPAPGGMPGFPQR